MKKIIGIIVIVILGALLWVSFSDKTAPADVLQLDTPEAVAEVTENVAVEIIQIEAEAVETEAGFSELEALDF
jgi:hypothetical protein